jgi:hypothetical protein
MSYDSKLMRRVRFGRSLQAWPEKKKPFSLLVPSFLVWFCCVGVLVVDNVVAML